jgi:phosphate transport system substrate-binding protein
VDTDEQIVDTVARYSGAMGLVSWVFAKPLVEAKRLRVLAVEGVGPAEGLRRRGAYPVEGPLVMVFREFDQARMAPFLDFLYGPAGQQAIGRALIPVPAAEAGYRKGGFLTRV